MTELYLTNSVTTIEYGALCGDPIRDIFFEGTKEQWNSIAIAEDAFDSDVLLIVPEGSVWVQWATDNGYPVMEHRNGLD